MFQAWNQSVKSKRENVMELKESRPSLCLLWHSLLCSCDSHSNVNFTWRRSLFIQSHSITSQIREMLTILLLMFFVVTQSSTLISVEIYNIVWMREDLSARTHKVRLLMKDIRINHVQATSLTINLRRCCCLLSHCSARKEIISLQRKYENLSSCNGKWQVSK